MCVFVKMFKFLLIVELIIDIVDLGEKVIFVVIFEK